MRCAFSVLLGLVRKPGAAVTVPGPFPVGASARSGNAHHKRTSRNSSCWRSRGWGRERGTQNWVAFEA